MTTRTSSRHRGQGGYTLIELIVASAIALMVMTALTSVVLTSVIGANTATSRVEASAQIRTFQLSAYDDFALSRPPATSGCGSSPADACTTQSMVLSGNRMPNVVGGSAAPYTVTYAWDPGQDQVTRTFGGVTRVAASNVTSFSWYVDNTNGQHSFVVVSMSVTVGFYNTSYTESQTLLFFPRVTNP